ncbi:MAG: hypothetical protein ACLTMP_01510 [Eggerthella lenta]
MLDAARAYLESWLAAGLAPVLLVPSPAAADRVRRALAGVVRWERAWRRL